MRKIKKIAVFTSGGDAPGMNACIRAIVRKAVHSNIEVVGALRGYEGLINNDFIQLDKSSVGNIIQKGGTILKTARSIDFITVQGRKKAFDNIQRNNIDAIVAIGGDGTFTGAAIFTREFGVPIIGVPGTIDNDLYGTDDSIGYDTALNTIVSAVDKIRDTANSHDRLFIVEVMGKDAGFIALRSGIAVGAEAILIPETHTYIDHLLNKLGGERRKNKSGSIVIVAEGDGYGGAYKVADAVKEKYEHFDIRVSILGHIQRGGNPSAFDRVLASRLGAGAVDALVEGRKGEMIGLVNKELVFTPFEKAVKHHKELNKQLLSLAEILAL
jgi:6-phosphofructokinase 1